MAESFFDFVINDVVSSYTLTGHPDQWMSDDISASMYEPLPRPSQYHDH